jgi:hypothetical protein
MRSANKSLMFPGEFMTDVPFQVCVDVLHDLRDDRKCSGAVRSSGKGDVCRIISFGLSHRGGGDDVMFHKNI